MKTNKLHVDALFLLPHPLPLPHPTHPPTVPPFIDGADEVTDNMVVINSPLELECQATGTPTPVIT